MNTYVYINKEGVKYAVFHTTDGGHKQWQHTYEERTTCKECLKNARK